MTTSHLEAMEDFLGMADFWIWETDEQLRVTHLSSGFESSTGLNRDALMGRAPGQFAQHEGIGGALGQRDALMEQRKPFSNVKSRISTDQNRARWIKTSGAPFFDTDNTFLGYRGTGHDMTAEVLKTEENLRDRRESRMQQTLLSNIGKISRIGAWTLSLTDMQQDWSPETYDIYEIPQNTDVSLEQAMSAYDEEEQQVLQTAIERARKDGSKFDVTLPFTTAKGNDKWVRAIGLTDQEGKAATRLFGTFQDVTTEHEKRLEVEAIALKDSLTGIGNRHSFNQELGRRIGGRCHEENQIVLCMADLDRFKEINDLHGHSVGDEALKFVANYLEARTGDDGYVARMGGDEFSLMFHLPGDAADPLAFLKQRIGSLQHQVDTSAGWVDVKLCLGFAVDSGPNIEPAELLRNADFALHAAKNEGSGHICEFAPSMAETFHRRVVVAQQFQQAVRCGEVVPHYQPIVELGTGKLSGLEALARWHHPTRGIIAPSLYMQVFDDNRICVELGKLMLQRICADMEKWLSEGIFFGRVGYNTTGADLKQPGFALNVLNTLSKHGLQTRHLVIEITETTMFSDVDSVVYNQLKQLRDAGVHIALDDFGTGHSSLTHLKNLPFNILKIDKSFVKDVMSSASDKSIIRSLIDLGRDIGYTTVAEGIELQAEVDFLRSVGCHRGQGYLFEKPKSAEGILDFLGGAVPPKALTGGDAA